MKRASVNSSRDDKLAVIYGLNDRQDVNITYSGNIEHNGDVVMKMNSTNTAEEVRTIKVSLIKDTHLSRFYSL